MAAVTQLELRSLLSACAHVARRAGDIIKAVHKDGQLGAYNKTADGDVRDATTLQPAEVLTIADTRAQDVIVTSLRNMFPGIRIVAEEDEASYGAQREVPSTMDEVPELAASFTTPPALAESLTLADTCLWIDPLDGTIEFVRGNLHHVCVLIGICVKNRPVAGVVHQPCVGGHGGTLTYGAVGIGVFGDRDPPVATAPPELRVGVEPKHVEMPQIQKGMSKLKAATNISQASGQNLLRVLRGENSGFVSGPGASRWDTCAGEALLQAVGGRLTDLTGQPYSYEQAASSFVNITGCIAARTADLHAELAAAFAEAEPDEKRPRK